MAMRVSRAGGCVSFHFDAAPSYAVRTALKNKGYRYQRIASAC